MDVLAQFPEVKPYLDKTDDYETDAFERDSGGKRYLVVTQRGQIDSGQLLFEIGADGLTLVDNDNTVEIGPRLDTLSSSPSLSCQISDPGDVAAVYAESLVCVDTFSSASGPEGGNLACVWAVRKIAKRALGRWITRTDGTAIFDPELRSCFGSNVAESNVPAGGIIISPTEGSNIGHVGLLGPPTGSGSRLIYSNSSAAAMWKQNFTLAKWIERYKERKGLKVHFFPIPNYVSRNV